MLFIKMLPHSESPTLLGSRSRSAGGRPGPRVALNAPRVCCGASGKCQAAGQGDRSVPEPPRTDSGSHPTPSGREEAGGGGGRRGSTISETRGSAPPAGGGQVPTGEFLPSCSFKFSTSEKQNKTQQRGVSAGGGQEGSRPQWRVFTCVARPQPGAPGAEESSVRTQPLRRPQGPPLQEDSPPASGGLTPPFRRTHPPRLQEDPAPPPSEDALVTLETRQK